ncbi:MAG: phage/plasmid primase, P4 family [Methylobacter sp.]|uniref:DNA primase family protein n=1 Tax=Methylobacter sp. TaxID=2051955 RepID=UPI002587271F|nr:phage/plasmid primase, P4 family [Methylobacter sp.]MCL7421533.1 phage/plasmid primase, P4 family [Methylobacter sp.]
MNNIEEKLKLGACEARIVTFTLMQSRTRLSKEFWLEGDIIKKKAAAQMTDGWATRTSIPFSQLPGLLNNATARQALCLGIHSGHKDKMPVRSQAASSSLRGAITRTKEQFQFPDGSGLLMLDHDPSEYGQSYTPDELLSILGDIHPAIESAARVVRGSVSAGVHRIGEQPAAGKGFHIYIPVRNAADIPRYGKALFERLWLAGHGFIALARNGAKLKRGLIDAAVFSPERLDFIAPPYIKDKKHLQYTPPETLYQDGQYLDTESLQTLNNDEADTLARLVADAGAAVDTESETKQAEWKAERVAEQVAAGVPETMARANIERTLESVNSGKAIDLYEDFILEFLTGPVSVADVLRDPGRYDNQPLADPCEGKAYGTTTAKFYINKDKPCINSNAHGGVKYFLHNEPINNILDDDGIIEQTLSSLDDDIAAWDTSEFLEALTDIYKDDRQAYRRIYHKLKKWRIASEVEKAVKVFYRKKNNLKKAAQAALPALPRDREDLTQHQPSTNPALEVDALVVYDDETGKAFLEIESKAAVMVANALRGFWAWSDTAQTWHKFVGTHWATQPAKGFDAALIELLYTGAGSLGYKPGYKNGIKSLIEDGQFLPIGENNPDLLPFKNGLLDLKTKSLHPIAPGNALTWCLPYSYDPGADCPNIKEWLLSAADDDIETLELLRAWMAAVIHGRADLQMFLHLIGMGGTGKGVFMRLLTALVGEQNTATTELRRMEQNQFEAAKFYNKRLITITDSSRYGGTLDKLKALTGQDHMPLERKHQQQEGGFIFGGIVVMASNEFLTSTDHTSGIDRRRSMIRFDQQATDEEKQAWAKRGGEGAVIHSELAGLVNWLLELSQDDIGRIIRNPPKRTQETNDEARKAINPIYAWVSDCCKQEDHAWTQVGDRREIREQGSEPIFEHSDERLYPNYLLWCQRNGHRATSSRKFKEDLIQTLKSSGWRANERRTAQGRGIDGIRLLKPWEHNAQ